MTAMRDLRQAEPLVKYAIWKTGLDRLAAAILLLPGLPIIMVLALLVRLTSRGPGIFRQVRVGRNGRWFTMYKIRTMCNDAENAKTGAVWAQANDPRTTAIGNWLRATHLDELPQLFNVIKGEMSLVGPRPERPEFVSLLSKSLPDYRKRLDVTPGVTGLAQINLPPDSDLESVRKKLHLDRAYIEKMSFAFDMKLLFCTAVTLVGIDGEWAARKLDIYRPLNSFSAGSIAHGRTEFSNRSASMANEDFQSSGTASTDSVSAKLVAERVELKKTESRIRLNKPR